MPFLSANGLEIPVAADTMAESVREIGQTVQAFSGTLVRSRQTVKRDIDLELPFLEPVLSGQWERWLRGEGEAWNFVNLYGSKGTAPESGYSGTIDAGNGVSGAALLVSSGSHAYRIAPSGSSWTFAIWYSNNATPGTGYSHYVVTSAGKKWLNGVRDDAAVTTWAAVSSGILTLTGGSNRRFDNLFAFPATPDDSWPPDWYGSAGAGLVAAGTARPPFLTLTGDAILETTRTALGEVSTTSVVIAQGGSRRRLTASLRQT
jgi:hypothetical protein